MKETKIALGTWAWGAGMFGGDTVFGSKTDETNLRPVFDAAMKAGLNLWDTATAYGMGESERILGHLASAYKREDVLISTKFTPQLAEVYDNSVTKMAEASLERMGLDYIDMYWIHNPMDVERWTPGLIPLLKSGKVRKVGVSNHNIKEIRRANEILGEAGFKVSAVQNHFSLLYRSSEKGGVLDYCIENVESLKSEIQHALNVLSERERKVIEDSYGINCQELTLEEIGAKYGLSCSQVGIAWALSKGTMPIIGATKERHVLEAAQVMDTVLTPEEITRLESLADAAGIDTRGDWEHTME